MSGLCYRVFGGMTCDGAVGVSMVVREDGH